LKNTHKAWVAGSVVVNVPPEVPSGWRRWDTFLARHESSTAKTLINAQLSNCIQMIAVRDEADVLVVWVRPVTPKLIVKQMSELVRDEAIAALVK